MLAGRLIQDWRIFFSNLRNNYYKEYKFSSITVVVYSLFDVVITKLMRLKGETGVEYTNFNSEMLNSIYEQGDLYAKMRKYFRMIKENRKS